MQQLIVFNLGDPTGEDITSSSGIVSINNGDELTKQLYFGASNTTTNYFAYLSGRQNKMKIYEIM
jgi:hypothetical protein